ncbi:hypothetical protein VF14_04425 [Nostoc linckia z18]|uniref:DUF1822 family protein n=2 Tax=Nostoc linckia TaxID=92942 RepID=A0A9Q6EJY2_NOSLI|nr:DUF1822 family protein [Nostoc linckia]PHK40444.1 hypothetical protein VF12_10525 [Nostoc linckia z15]PHK47980.1 hypothetical protein VF13_02440 [Nostoc linckia z16]PHJ61104.1 hypothetical protein VF05_29290 [Nostoc linckia z3]PHJ64751.1 hypothetical protein VF02_12075 [Nostoc linckia z1]PHJ71009.1 hypothetical protein VF03_21130 [Nostoc linckia z2]
MSDAKMHKSTVPLSRKAHQLAKKFAAQQLTPEKGKQVYLNTLSVYAVHRYLKYLGIHTNLEQSDCWQLSNQVISDIADLVLPEMNQALVCCPILPGQTHLELPLEMIENLLGYVGVQFNNMLREVELMGFLPVNHANDEEIVNIGINELRSLDILIEYIYAAKARQHTEDIIQEIGLLNKFKNINVTGIFQEHVKDISSERVLSYATRSLAMKTLVTPINLGSQHILLIAEITPKDQQRQRVSLRLETIDSEELPSFQLSIVDESEHIFPHKIDLESPTHIQLQPFIANIGEAFQVKIVSEDISVTEYFVIF